MRKLSLIVLAGLVGLGAWGVGGCGGGSGASVDVVNPSNFTGTYELRDENCNDAMPNGFIINDASNSLTITNPGSSIFNEGDFFTLVEDELPDGRPSIESGPLGCLASFITNEGEAENVRTNGLIDAEAGDLIFVCSDSSADGACSGSYARVSSDI